MIPRNLLAALCCCGLVAGAGATALAQSEAAPLAEASPELRQQIQSLIEQLEAPDFEARQEATRQLAQIGLPAVPYLQEISLDLHMEQAVRAMQVLSLIHQSRQAEAIDAAELALLDVMLSENSPMSRRARQILDEHYVISEERAIAEIQRLGGTVERSQDNVLVFNPGQNLFVQPQNDGKLPLHRVVIGSSWKGGDGGLKQVFRLRYLPELYVIQGSGITQKGVEQIQVALPGTKLNLRGKAFLGVSMVATNLGCQIGVISPNSAAERAKLQVNDIIATFDGKPTPDPQTLINIIGGYNPGDKLKLEVYRGNTGLKEDVTITLGGWTDLPQQPEEKMNPEEKRNLPELPDPFENPRPLEAPKP